MAGPTLIPAGDFRSTYAEDTTMFPTTTSRNMAILGAVLICFAPLVFSAYWLSILIQIGIFSHRSPRPQYPGRLHRPDFDRARRLLPVRRLHLGLHQQQLPHSGLLRHSARRRRHGAGRPDLRRAGRAAEGTLSRHRDTGGAVHPARLLLARGMVFGRHGAGERQSVLDLRLHTARRQAVFLRRAGLCRGQLSSW